MIIWPAFIKHGGDAELDYINDQATWDRDADLHASAYDASDSLIDSTGAVFSLVSRPDGKVGPRPTGEKMTLEQVLGMVKAHAAQADSCCVAKLFAPTIPDAMAMIKALDSEAR